MKNNNWQIKSLGEVVKISKGKKLNSLVENKTSSSKRFIQIDDLRNSDVLKYTEDKSGVLVNKKDVLIAWDGANAGTIGFGLDGFIGSTIARLEILDDSIFTNYLGLYLRTKSKYLRDNCTGATIPHINKSVLESLKIPIPPLPIQKQIAEILEQADKSKQKRKEANKLTDEFLQSVFIEMFGDPVKNPKGWEIVKVDDISSKVTSGSTPLGGDINYLSEGIRFIRSQNILMNRIDYSDIVFISKTIHNNMSRTWVKKNDVLFNITGASIGRVAYFEGENDSANVNQHVCIVRTEKEKINHIYLSYLISSESFQSRVISQNSGATRQAFNFEQIRNFKIILPPLQLQQQFAQIVNKTEALKEKQKKTEQELENLFQSLMQKAFKGGLVS